VVGEIDTCSGIAPSSKSLVRALRILLQEVLELMSLNWNGCCSLVSNTSATRRKSSKLNAEPETRCVTSRASNED